ncbi:hypothetical protein [Sulfurimonas sp.]|uniref:hypothetical protein n=1 Tax=Sulfurimonas sp. TaxID=2022749 RepID=UPI003D13B85A
MKVLSPKITTSQARVFYKEVVNDENKVVDKVFLIRYRDEIGREKQKTIGKYSQGVNDGVKKRKANHSCFNSRRI